jgi:hypothetical protein
MRDEATPLAEVSFEEPEATDYATYKLGSPFPAPDEVIDWPALKDLQHRELPNGELNRIFDDRHRRINKAIFDWQKNVENQVIGAWRQYESTASNHADRVAEQADQIVQAASSVDSSQLVVGTLPKCKVIFRRPDGALTKNLADLPAYLQSLLRPSISPDSNDYLRVVPYPKGYNSSGSSPSSGIFVSSFSEELAVLVLLEFIGRPKATRVEMDAMGEIFKCARCSCRILNWGRLVCCLLSL